MFRVQTNAVWWEILYVNDRTTRTTSVCPYYESGRGQRHHTSLLCFLWSLLWLFYGFLWNWFLFPTKHNICTVKPPRYERPKIRVFDVTSLQMLHDFDPDTRKFTSYECSTQLHFFHRNLKILIKYNPSLRHSVALSCSLSAKPVLFLITFSFYIFKNFFLKSQTKKNKNFNLIFLF